MSGDDIQIWMEGEVNREIMVFIITTINLTTSIIITNITPSVTITISTLLQTSSTLFLALLLLEHYKFELEA